jgi:sigma54-dependent transcription regulator
MLKSSLTRKAGLARAITVEKLATDEQIARLRKAYQMLGRGELDATGLTATAANELIEQLTVEYRQMKKAS